MMVCNLLVIVTFVYRILHKDETGFGDSLHEMRSTMIEFTTIDLAEGGLSQETSKVTSSVPSGRTKSSTWSFRAGSRSKTSGSVAVAVSRVDTLPVSAEEEYSRSGLSVS